MAFHARTSILSALASDGTHVTARVFETSGALDHVSLTLPSAIAKATVTDLEGAQIASASVEGCTATFALPAHRMAQLNLTLNR